MSETILVTGGCGFIGSHLVDDLIAAGRNVRVIDNLTAQVHPGGRKPEYLNPGAEYVVADITDDGVLETTLAGVDVLVHFAAAVGVGQSMYEPEHYVHTNSVGTAKLWQAVLGLEKKPRKVLVASSMSIYGEGRYVCKNCGPARGHRSEEALREGHWEPTCATCQGPLEALPTDEAHHQDPTSIYALSKYDQERMSLALGAAYSIPTVALRFFNVYGTRQSLSNPYTGVGAIFSSRIRSDSPPTVYEDGMQQRDFVHVRDIVQACRLVMDSDGADGRAFNVGSGRAITIRDLAKLLIDLHGKTGSLQPEITGRFRTGDIRHCFADISKIRELGYEPKVSLESGLRELEDWSQTAPTDDKFDAAQGELHRRGLA